MRRSFALFWLAALLLRAAAAEETEHFGDLSLEDLAKIKVTVASKIAELTREAPSVVSIVTAREIELFGARTLRDVMDLVPGAGAVTSIFSRHLVSLRGDQSIGLNNHVLVLLNGRPMRETIQGGQDSELYFLFPVESIERIEVVRGPGSVLHGTNAYAGVVNIVTREARKGYGSIDALVGSLGTRQVVVEGSAVLGKSELSGTARIVRRPDWQQRMVDELGRDAGFTMGEEGGSGLLTYRRAGFTAQGFYAAWDADVLNPIAALPVVGTERKRGFIDLGYRKEFSSRWTGTLNATYSRIDSNTQIFSHPQQRVQVSEAASEDLVLETTQFLRLGERWNIVLGSLLNRLSGDASVEGSPTVPEYSKLWWSAYSQVGVHLAGPLRFTAGGQAIHISNRPLKFVPRLGLVYSSASGWGAKLLYGEAFRAPAPIETDLDLPPVFQSNPDLDPEVVSTADLELFHQSKKVQASVALFRSEQRDRVTRDLSASPSTFVNSGTFEVQGIELEVKLVPTTRWYLFGSAAYQTNELDGAFEDTTPVPGVTARLGIAFAPFQALSIGAVDVFYGKPGDVSVLNPDRRLVNPVPEAFHHVNLNARLNLGRALDWQSRSSVILHARVENLLDEDIWAPEFTRRVINSIPGLPGRAFYAGATLRWGAKD